jgi:hypothetical protein
VLGEGHFEGGVEIAGLYLAERRGFEGPGPGVEDPGFSACRHPGTVQK